MDASATVWSPPEASYPSLQCVPPKNLATRCIPFLQHCSRQKENYPVKGRLVALPVEMQSRLLLLLCASFSIHVVYCNVNFSKETLVTMFRWIWQDRRFASGNITAEDTKHIAVNTAKFYVVSHDGVISALKYLWIIQATRAPGHLTKYM